MRNKLALLFSAMLVAATGYGQNAVMVNKSNGVITYPNNFWTANALQGRTGLGLGSAATNASTTFQSSSSVLSNLTSSNAVNLTNLRASNVVGTVGLASNIVGIAAITNGGTGATNAEGARSALGMPLSILTNADVLTFRGSLFPEFDPFTGGNEVNMTEDTISAPVIESKVNVTFGAPNSAGVLVLRSPNSTDTTNYTATIMYSDGVAGGYGQFTAPTNNTNVTILLPPKSGQLALATLDNVGTNSGVARTNLSLGASWLTNTNSSSFLSAIGGMQNNATNASFGVTSPATTWINKNWLTLPIRFGEPTTRGAWAVYSEFDGAPKFSLAYGLAALNTNPTVNDLLVVRSNSFIISGSLGFSSTDYAAATRTNLGLGESNDVVFNSIIVGSANASQPKIQAGLGFVGVYDNIDEEYIITMSSDSDPVTLNSQWNDAGVRSSLGLPWSGLTNTDSSGFRSALELSASWLSNTNVTNFRTAIGLGTTNDVQFGQITASNIVSSNITVGGAIFFTGSSTNLSATRTNLGLGWSALTNTNSAAFRTAIGLNTNNDVTFSNVISSGTLTATSTVTTKTNIVVEGFVNFPTNRIVNTPTNAANFADRSHWLEIKINGDSHFIPVYQ